MFTNKKLLIYLLLPVFTLILSACSNIEEDYFIFSDGSVVYQQKNDLTTFFTMLAEESEDGEEMTQEDIEGAELSWKEDMCEDRPDDALYYNCYMTDKIAYKQSIFMPKTSQVLLENGVYEISLYDFSDIFEMVGEDEGDQLPEGMDFTLESRFKFEGEVLYSDIGEINGDSVIVSLDDLKAMEEGQEAVVRARINDDTAHVEEVLYRSQIKEDGSLSIFWPYVFKEYLIKAQEVWGLSANELHEQIIDTTVLVDGSVDEESEVYFERVGDNYYSIWPDKEKINFHETNNGNLEVYISDALYFDLNDNYLAPIEAKYEIDFFSDIISADVGTISGNILKIGQSDLSQLTDSSKLIITKSENHNPKVNNIPIQFSQIKNQKMHTNLKGKILLQVEENGEAYYIHPEKLEMFSLGRPADAFKVMREQGIGINNENLLKIPVADASSFKGVDSDNDGYDDYTELMNDYNPYGGGKLNYDLNFSKKSSGKIFLQVEANGEAWYVNPGDSKRYFLGRPSDAFEIMRTLGLGISNENLESLTK